MSSLSRKRPVSIEPEAGRVDRQSLRPRHDDLTISNLERYSSSIQQTNQGHTSARIQEGQSHGSGIDVYGQRLNTQQMPNPYKPLDHFANSTVDPSTPYARIAMKCHGIEEGGLENNMAASKAGPSAFPSSCMSDKTRLASSLDVEVPSDHSDAIECDLADGADDAELEMEARAQRASKPPTVRPSLERMHNTARVRRGPQLRK